jgi:hypothetical protein
MALLLDVEVTEEPLEPFPVPDALLVPVPELVVPLLPPVGESWDVSALQLHTPNANMDATTPRLGVESMKTATAEARRGNPRTFQS